MVPPKCPKAAVAMLGLLPLIGVQVMFSGYFFSGAGTPILRATPSQSAGFPGRTHGIVLLFGLLAFRSLRA